MAPPAPNVDALTCTSIDVQNTMTHELGHSIGLAHSPDSRSTMYAGAQRGEISKRVLDDGSKEFVCTVYPKGQASRDCNGAVQTPRPKGPASGCGASPIGVLMVGGWIVGRLRRRGVRG